MRTLILLVYCVLCHAAEPVDVRAHGATGDGTTLDTAAIQKAIDACAAAGGGQVRFTPGTYLSGTIILRDRIELHFARDARLLGTPDLTQYRSFSGKDARLKPNNWLRGLIIGEGVSDIAFTGPGTIDGNDVPDPLGEEKMRGPHTILLGGCRRVVMTGVTMRRAANYAFLYYHTHDVRIEDAAFIGGWDGVHFRASDQDRNRGLTIRRCRFATGDDSIAGCFQDGTVIEDCAINSSCNGIRLIGPVKDFTVARCTFLGPGEEPHRTSREKRRTNTLAAIAVQPGAWDRKMAGASDRLVFRDLTMRDVASAFHIVAIEGTPFGSIAIERVKATGVYRSPLTVESWAEPTFASVTFTGVDMTFAGGGKEPETRLPVKRPGVDCRPLPAWGLFARNVQRLAFTDTVLRCAAPDARPAVLKEGVATFADTGLRIEAAR